MLLQDRFHPLFCSHSRDCGLRNLMQAVCCWVGFAADRFYVLFFCCLVWRRCGIWVCYGGVGVVVARRLAGRGSPHACIRGSNTWPPPRRKFRRPADFATGWSENLNATRLFLPPEGLRGFRQFGSGRSLQLAICSLLWRLPACSFAVAASRIGISVTCSARFTAFVVQLFSL